MIQTKTEFNPNILENLPLSVPTKAGSEWKSQAHQSLFEIMQEQLKLRDAKLITAGIGNFNRDFAAAWHLLGEPGYLDSVGMFHSNTTNDVSFSLYLGHYNPEFGSLVTSEIGIRKLHSIRSTNTREKLQTALVDLLFRANTDGEHLRFMDIEEMPKEDVKSVLMNAATKNTRFGKPCLRSSNIMHVYKEFENYIQTPANLLHAFGKVCWKAPVLHQMEKQLAFFKVVKEYVA